MDTAQGRPMGDSKGGRWCLELHAYSTEELGVRKEKVVSMGKCPSFSPFPDFFPTFRHLPNMHIGKQDPQVLAWSSEMPFLGLPHAQFSCLARSFAPCYLGRLPCLVCVHGREALQTQEFGPLVPGLV